MKKQVSTNINISIGGIELDEEQKREVIKAALSRLMELI